MCLVFFNFDRGAQYRSESPQRCRTDQPGSTRSVVNDRKQSSVLFSRNSQTLDEEDVLSDVQKSPVINLPDKTAGASQPQGSPGLPKTKCTALEPAVRNLSSPFLTWSLSHGKTADIVHILTPAALICFVVFKSVENVTLG